MSGPSTESQIQNVGIKEGNLYFCVYCRNIMEVISSENSLEWKCSIGCENSLQTGNAISNSDDLIILSETVDNTRHSDLGPNENTIHDPTLIRCKRECSQCNDTTEMIIYKQNLSDANSFMICTQCGGGT